MTVGSGLTLAGGTLSASGGWTTLLDLDLAAQPSVNFKSTGDGTYSVGGFTWTVVGTANANKFQIVNGTGLVTQASIASAQFFQVRISNLGSQYAISNNDFRIWTRVVYTVGAGNGPIAGSQARDTADSSSAQCALWWNAGTRRMTLENNFAGSNVVQPAGPITDDVCVTQVQSLQLVGHYSGAYSSGWPTPANLKMRAELKGTNANVTRTGDALNQYLLGYVYACLGTNVTDFVCTHIRIDAR